MNEAVNVTYRGGVYSMEINNEAIALDHVIGMDISLRAGVTPKVTIYMLPQDFEFQGRADVEWTGELEEIEEL